MDNEEKILAILEQQGKTLEQHGKMLEQQGKMLEQQGKTLEQHGKMLEQHWKMLLGMREELTEVHEIAEKVAVTQEAVVLPRLDLLAEGHTHLADTLAGKSRVEKLEEELDFVKTVVKALSKEIAELKKAQ